MSVRKQYPVLEALEAWEAHTRAHIVAAHALLLRSSQKVLHAASRSRSPTTPQQQFAADAAQEHSSTAADEHSSFVRSPPSKRRSSDRSPSVPSVPFVEDEFAATDRLLHDLDAQVRESSVRRSGLSRSPRPAAYLLDGAAARDDGRHNTGLSSRISELKAELALLRAR
jgi:hypothetical protein